MTLRIHPFLSTVLCLAAIFACASQAPKNIPAGPLCLDALDDGKQLKLLVQHPEIGPVCELWCYEGGPFGYGTAVKSEDGAVVFLHTSGKMNAKSTFTPAAGGRISMDILVEGPLEELKKVIYMGPCMQLWHSEKFKRESTLVDFAERCFLYTARGPVGMLDTARGPMKGFTSSAPENNPPWTQWYVPIRATHPGDIWAFGASGDRPLSSLVGVTSRDGKWLAAIGCAEARTLGQGWHDCIHHVPQMQAYLDEGSGRIQHRSMIYVMANDRRALLESFQRDFPDDHERSDTRILAGKNGALRIAPPSQSKSGLDLHMEVVSHGRQRKAIASTVWRASSWGGFIRGGESWRMWAFPRGEEVEIWVSRADGTGPGKVEAAWSGKGWAALPTPGDVPAIVRQSPDGSWIAALIWEQHESAQPSIGVLGVDKSQGGTRSVRGRVFVFRGDVQSLRERWLKTKTDWTHSRPYSMPVEKRGNFVGVP